MHASNAVGLGITAPFRLLFGLLFGSRPRKVVPTVRR
jgi:hypothetical protein